MEQKLCLRAGEGERNGVTAAAYDPFSAPGCSLVPGPEAAERHACFSRDSGEGEPLQPAPPPGGLTSQPLTPSAPRPATRDNGSVTPRQ